MFNNENLARVEGSTDQQSSNHVQLDTNAFLLKPPSVDELKGFFDSANVEFNNAKSNAMRAAANAYLLWYHAESDHAEIYAKQWLIEAIAGRNEEIKTHNSSIDSLKLRVKHFKEGELNAQPTEDEARQLQKYANYTAADWIKLKLVPIGTRVGSSKFTRIVKFIFKFDKPADASDTSRYAKVLEDIEQHNDEMGERNVDAIVKQLTDAGGFEAAIERMRGNDNRSDEVAGDAALNKIKAAVDGADIGGFDFTAKHAIGNYVFFIGRQDGGKITVCSELAINDNEASDLLLKVDAGIFGPCDPFVEFASSVCSLAELVQEGRASNITIDGTKAGEKHKAIRTYSLCTREKRSCIIVSGRYTDASAVIHAYPKGINIGSVEVGKILMLTHKDGAVLGKQLGDIKQRMLTTITSKDGDADASVCWNVQSEISAAKVLAWTSMFDQQHRPVDLRLFQGDCWFTLTKKQVKELSGGCLYEWGKNKPDDQKVTKPLSVSIHGAELTVGHEVYGKHTLTISQQAGARVSINLRPRDLVDLCKKLIEQDADVFTVKCDGNGMIAFEWEDGVGHYAVYLPAVEPKAGLNKACLGYMKPTK
jgi:hypothetical protein